MGPVGRRALCVTGWLCGPGCTRDLARSRDDGNRVAPALSLRAVSCASSSACTAIGWLNTRSGAEPVAERWDGSSWSPQPIPTPRDSDILRVSCPSLTSCFAVGYASVLAPNGDLKRFIGLVERWDGAGWSRQATTEGSRPDQR
jgi:hypothetical protein